MVATAQTTRQASHARRLPSLKFACSVQQKQKRPAQKNKKKKKAIGVRGGEDDGAIVCGELLLLLAAAVFEPSVEADITLAHDDD